MAGKNIGYIRVSSIDQNEHRQLIDIKCDKIFTEKKSGKDTNRPKLQELIEYVRDDDIVHVHSLDRLARNLDDLRKTVKTLTDKGVSIRFHKENLTFTGEDSPMSTLLLSVIGSFAEFERALIKERQAEGIALAKKAGKYKGRKKALNEDQLIEIKSLLQLKVPKAEIARRFNVARKTLYGALSN